MTRRGRGHPSKIGRPPDSGCFAELKDPVKDKLKRFELLEQFGDEGFYPTLGAAVDDYLKDYELDWQP